jgi:hypothetical protein
MALIDDLEFVADRLDSIREAEELAEAGLPNVVSELRALHDQSVQELLDIARKILKGPHQLGARHPHVPLELLERLFVRLRDQAEKEWSGAIKATGRREKIMRKNADELARMAQAAALAVRMSAERHGMWTEKYAREHGLLPWL